MAERSASAEMWIGRGAYFAVALVVVFVSLLPMQTVPRNWAGPDVMVALTFCWAARRPDFVPAILVALILLLHDFIYMRPPGLWAALVVIASEALRRRSLDLRAVPYMLEWATVAATIIGIFMVYRFAHAVFAIPQVPLAPHMFQMVLTVLCYPVVAFGSFVALGIRRPAPGEVDALGHRI